MGRYQVLGALVLLGSACGPAWEACLSKDPPPFCLNPAAGAVSPEPFAGAVRARECCRAQCDGLPDPALDEEEALRRWESCEAREQALCEQRARAGETMTCETLNNLAIGADSDSSPRKLSPGLAQLAADASYAVLARSFGAGSAGEELLVADWPTSVPEGLRHRWASSVRSAGELARKEHLRGVVRRLEVQPFVLPDGLAARPAVLVTESWDYLPLPAALPAYACGGGMQRYVVVQAPDGLDFYATDSGVDQGPCGPSPSSPTDDPVSGERTDD
jgi:hypothetical protein